ncbi:MAG: argininosuccinate lyase [Anaerolineales bacterium]
MTLWRSRIPGESDPSAQALNSSLAVDHRLGPQDVRASAAWSRALLRAGVLTPAEAEKIATGLAAIGTELETGGFGFQETDEDIHTAVERRLTELIGPLAGKLHTGRSRNDQVVTDFRLWVLDHLPALDTAIADLQASLLERAEADAGITLPGYTHLQRAQPILLSHWWLSHFWALTRDRERLDQVRHRTGQLPLGSAALAGTAYPIDRDALAADLGFEAALPNSLDAVSDRDFAVEFLFCVALTGVHLSRLSEPVVLFCSREFGFFEIADAFATGSSQMPQKRNADVFELARGKAGAMIGALAGLLATLKGLPSAYDRDLQEDKLPVFMAHDNVSLTLPALTGALRSLVVHRERMQSALEPDLFATDLADYLVRRGIPFRQAFEISAGVIRLAGERSKSISELSLDDLRTLSPAFESDVHDVFDVSRSLAQHSARGGTAPEAVAEQLKEARRAWSHPARSAQGGKG